MRNRALRCSIKQTRGRGVLGLAETRAERLGFAKPSTMVLDLAKLRADGTWAGRNKGGNAWFSQNRAPLAKRRAEGRNTQFRKTKHLATECSIRQKHGQEALAVALAWYRWLSWWCGVADRTTTKNCHPCHCGGPACRGWFRHGWVVSICQLVVQ